MRERETTSVLIAAAFTLSAGCAPSANRADTAATPPARWGAAITEPRVVMDTVTLFDGRDSIRAYIARPRGSGRHPAVIVLHANRITEPYIASTTAMLAEAGFVALAVAREFREPRLVRNVQAGIEYLRRESDVDPGGVALVGFCGGGWNALLLSAQLSDVGAVVAFYAPVASSDVQHRSPLELVSYIRVPVLYQRAMSDQFIPLSDVERFETALRTQGTPIERIDYDAAHGFFAWNRNGVFDEQEATRAWAATVRFLREHAGRSLQSRDLAPARTSFVPSHGVGAARLASMHVLHLGE